MNGISSLASTDPAASGTAEGQQIAADGFKEPEAAGTAPAEQQ